MTEQLQGRRIVITGGASGMGAGLVRAFPQLGARVAALDLAADTGRKARVDGGTLMMR
jgi:NAD(P)-dependent dehydrogenase (short-subunit alcohol dehydrogenase family)